MKMRTNQPVEVMIHLALNGAKDANAIETVVSGIS